jgi:hypothetical protein
MTGKLMAAAIKSVAEYQDLAARARTKASNALDYGNPERAKEWLEVAEAAERSARIAMGAGEGDE